MRPRSGPAGIVAHTSTDGSGSFSFASVPSGRYEVVVSDGVDEARTETEVTWAPEIVTVRLPERAASPVGGRDRVSVNQLQAPPKARDAVRRALAAMHGGDIGEARRQVERALALDPQYADALTLRGGLQLATGHRDQARTDLEEAARCDSANPDSYLLLGVAYNSLHRFDDAMRVIALTPNSWTGYFEMGVALLGKRDFPGALRQFDKAQGLAPQDLAAIHLAKAEVWKGLQDPVQEKLERDAYRSRAASQVPAAPPHPETAEAPALPPDKK